MSDKNNSDLVVPPIVAEAASIGLKYAFARYILFPILIAGVFVVYFLFGINAGAIALAAIPVGCILWILYIIVTPRNTTLPEDRLRPAIQERYGYDLTCAFFGKMDKQSQVDLILEEHAQKFRQYPKQYLDDLANCMTGLQQEHDEARDEAQRTAFLLEDERGKDCSVARDVVCPNKNKHERIYASTWPERILDRILDGPDGDLKFNWYERTWDADGKPIWRCANCERETPRQGCNRHHPVLTEEQGFVTRTVVCQKCGGWNTSYESGWDYAGKPIWKCANCEWETPRQ